MGEPAREASRLVAGHVLPFARAYILSAAARLSRTRTPRTAADPPPRPGTRPAGRTHGAGRRATPISLRSVRDKLRRLAGATGRRGWRGRPLVERSTVARSRTLGSRVLGNHRAGTWIQLPRPLPRHGSLILPPPRPPGGIPPVNPA